MSDFLCNLEFIFLPVSIEVYSTRRTGQNSAIFLTWQLSQDGNNSLCFPQSFVRLCGKSNKQNRIPNPHRMKHA
jgi:hypothetical protein